MEQEPMPDKENQGEADATTVWIDRYMIDRLAFKRETIQSSYALILRQFPNGSLINRAKNHRLIYR